MEVAIAALCKILPRAAFSAGILVLSVVADKRGARIPREQQQF